MHPDMVLVKRCQNGDAEAFRELVTGCQKQIFSLIFRLVGDQQMVEDLAQEVFLKAYQNISKFQGKSSFYTWVYRIAVNSCIDYLRGKKRSVQSKKVSWTDLTESEKAGMSVSFHDPGLEFENKELGLKIKEAIKSLPPELSVVVKLREIEGLSYQEIANALDCPQGTVRSRLFRARQELQQKLRKYLESSGYQSSY